MMKEYVERSLMTRVSIEDHQVQFLRVNEETNTLEIKAVRPATGLEESLWTLLTSTP